MPIGPQGQRRPADLVGCVRRVFDIATGDAEEFPPKRADKVPGGRAGGLDRAKALSPARRREIARQGVVARAG